MKYELKVQYMHELGSRSNQEDSIYPKPAELSDNARCFVLCDGMGGHDSGEVASDAVCSAMGAYADACNRGDAPFTVEDLRNALNAAYDELDRRDTQSLKKMGTTMTFLAFHAGGCLVAHIGDSRVYHLRPGKGILYETRDHSLVNDLIKVGELTEEAAKDFPQKNVITRVMQPNQERRSRADIKEITDVRPGDYFFMCSDGVNETMESCNIANVLLNQEHSDADKMRIIKSVTESSRDNHTAFLIRVANVDGGNGNVETVVGETVANNEILRSAQDNKDRAEVYKPNRTHITPAERSTEGHQVADNGKSTPKRLFNKKTIIVLVALIVIFAATFVILGKSNSEETAASVKKPAENTTTAVSNEQTTAPVKKPAENTTTAVSNEQTTAPVKKPAENTTTAVSNEQTTAPVKKPAENTTTAVSNEQAVAPVKEPIDSTTVAVANEQAVAPVKEHADTTLSTNDSIKSARDEKLLKIVNDFKNQ